VDRMPQPVEELAELLDNVLQELFAIGLHLERVQRVPDQARTAADTAIDSLSATADTLRAIIKHLVAEADRRPAERPGGASDG